MNGDNYSLRLLSIGEIEGGTAINQRAIRRLGNRQASVDMNVRMIPDTSNNIISLVVTCSYIGIIGLIRERLLTCSAIATFEIENLDENADSDGNDQILNEKIAKTMLSITVGALRGIIAVRTANTPLHNSPLPILNLNALLGRLNFGSSKFK